MRIAHIVNPFAAAEASDLAIAQPITFTTMKNAASFGKHEAEVSLWSAQFSEDLPMVPEGFSPTPDLERSILDVRTFHIPRKLPLIKDILDRLYHHSDARCLVYTNVDIALQPYFYGLVARFFQQGYDAFVINRRTIPGNYKTVAEIPLMLAEVGERHPGWDCFAFERSLYPEFKLGAACIGSGWIGRVMITNMACLAKNFNVFADLHLTFHIGNEKVWRSGAFDDYTEHNKNECCKILLAFEKKYGPFDRKQLPGRFLNQLETTATGTRK